MISELVASNALGLLDYYDNSSDCLDITNRGLLGDYRKQATVTEPDEAC